MSVRPRSGKLRIRPSALGRGRGTTGVYSTHVVFYHYSREGPAMARHRSATLPYALARPLSLWLPVIRSPPLSAVGVPGGGGADVGMCGLRHMTVTDTST